MKKPGSVVLGCWIWWIVVTAPCAFSQAQAPSQEAASQPAAQSSSPSAIRAGTKIAAELESTVDTRTAKPGDEVVARVSKDVKQEGRTVIRKGDRLVGRVRSVEAKENADAGSRLAVEFDRLVQGRMTQQLNTVVTAILSTRAEPAAFPEPIAPGPPTPGPATPPSSGSAGNAGLLGGLSSTVNSTVGATGTVLGTAGGALETTGQAGIGYVAGVAGATPAKAINLHTQAAADQQTSSNTVLGTDKGHLRLESGTNLQFRVIGQAESRGPKAEQKAEQK